MKYFNILEVAKILEIKDRKAYAMIKYVEDTTPHLFGRAFLGNYYRAKERKEKVVSERDLKLLLAIRKTLLEDKTLNFEQLVQKFFGFE